jgi:hypothetical protein
MRHQEVLPMSNKHLLRIAVDFDGTIVSQDRAYFDLLTPLCFLDDAEYGLRALRKYGHELILWSARSNLALRRSYTLHPGFREQGCPLWLTNPIMHLNEQRYQQMVKFVNDELPGIFSYIDDGMQGKVLADLFIEDRAWNSPATPIDWIEVVRTLTNPEILREYLAPDWDSQFLALVGE